MKPLYNDRYAVVAGTKNPWSHRRRIAFAELMNGSWALPPPDSVIGSVATATFRASGLNFPDLTRVDPHAGTADQPSGDRALSDNLSDICSSVCRQTRNIKVLPIQLPMARVSLGVVTLKGRTLSPVAQLFIRSARQVAKPLANRE